VRFGSNPGFDRAVFDWPEDVDYRIEQNGRTATMTFGAPVALNQAAIAAGLQASTSSVRTARTADRATIEMTLNENVGLRHFRAGPRVVLDLVRDGSIPTDRPTTQLVQLPTPAQAQATQAQAAQAQAAQAQAAQAQAQGAQARQPASAAQAPAATQAARRSGTPDFEVLAQQAQALGLNQSAAPAASGRSAAANLVALRGRIPVEVTREENFDALRFGFDEPIGLAVFGRGQNLWIAFDKPVNLDLAALQSGPQMRDMLGEVDIVESQGSVLRMSPRNGAFALVRRDGAAWVVELGRLPRRPEKPLQIVIRNPDTPADARVSIEMEGAQTVLRLRDPEIGDELAIVPTAVAGNGLAETRRYPQFQILASMQGAVVRPDDDTVAVRPLGTAVEISSSRALFVTAPTAIGTPGAPPLRQGALLDLAAWQRGGPAKFNEDQSALERAVAASRPGDARNQARLDYARFMFSHGLFAETNAMLRLIGEERPQLLDGPQNRAMRGVAELYSGNLDEAARWLNHSSLDQEGEAAMWRGALAMAQNDPQAALLQFDRATDVSGRFPPLFANRLGLAIAEARIEGKELDVAQRRIEQVLAASPSRGDQARADYLRGRIALERGDERAALAAWRTLSLGTVTRARVQAELARIELQSGKGEISPQETVAALDRMRFAWRGDELEFEIHRRLGNAQLAAGDFRQGVRTLRETAERFPMARDRAELENDVRAEFRKLFLTAAPTACRPSPRSACSKITAILCRWVRRATRWCASSSSAWSRSICSIARAGCSSIRCATACRGRRAPRRAPGLRRYGCSTASRSWPSTRSMPPRASASPPPSGASAGAWRPVLWPIWGARPKRWRGSTAIRAAMPICCVRKSRCVRARGLPPRKRSSAWLARRRRPISRSKTIVRGKPCTWPCRSRWRATMPGLRACANDSDPP
jgi:tetratricopeptide (TPR) repeat protein